MHQCKDVAVSKKEICAGTRKKQVNKTIPMLQDLSFYWLQRERHIVCEVGFLGESQEKATPRGWH